MVVIVMVVVMIVVVLQNDMGVNHPSLVAPMRMAERFLRQPAEEAGETTDRDCRAPHDGILWMPQA
jgi:hypothetical protein